MSSEPATVDFNPAYISGLLDATGRVRFQLSDTEDGQYTVRASLRIYPYNTPIREAVIGSFLDTEGYEYSLVDRNHGADYFRIDYSSELQDLCEYLKGSSAHLVRELEFVNTVFSDQFDTEILTPKEAYRFLLTRNELRYGWRPRAPNLVSPSDIKSKHNFDADDVTTPELPEGSLRGGYSIDYIAGFFDGRCRYRPSIAQTDEADIGYMMQPVARLYRGGVSKSLIEYFQQFCHDYNLKMGDSSGEHNLNCVFTGPGAIRRILEIIFPRLTVAVEYSGFLDEIIFPRFDANDHLTKQGFVETLQLMERVAIESGGSYGADEYTSDYFAELWDDKIAIDEIDAPTGEDEPSTEAEESSTVDTELEAITVSPEDYTELLGQFHTVNNRQQRDREIVAQLKRLYTDRCQLCGDRRARPDGTGYSEVHHLKPLGTPHEGPDEQANMIVVCPNHHRDFDNGVVSVDYETLEITHPYDRSVDGRTLTVEDDHDIDSSYLRYHNKELVANPEIDS